MKKVATGSPAERAAMKVGDVLKKVDSEGLDGSWGTERALLQIEMRPVGELAKLTIERDDKEQTIELKLEPPHSP